MSTDKNVSNKVAYFLGLYQDYPATLNFEDIGHDCARQAQRIVFE